MDAGAALTIAREAAAAGGRIILQGRQAAHDVQTKSSFADLVTEIDRAAERAITEVIQRESAGHPVLGEETFAQRGLTLEQAEAETQALPHLWVVDPLDGTTNYVHGVPFFGVSIAYLEHGTVQAGVVYDPVRNEWFEAARGRGATLNGSTLRVSTEATLRTSLVATGFQFDPERGRRVNLEPFVAVAQRSRNVRALGSAALALAYVAAGRLSGFWELRLGPWDMAAGALLVEEAGGRLTDLAGGPFRLFGRRVLATNGSIHDQLLAVLAGAGVG